MDALFDLKRLFLRQNQYHLMDNYPKDFSKWTTDRIHRAFDIKKSKQLLSLDVWMSRNPPPLQLRELSSLQFEEPLNRNQNV
jgi:hypothetical protein